MDSTNHSLEKSLQEFALYYAKERDWPILPLHYPKDGICSCGNPECDTPAKHPLGKLVHHGLLDATTDLKKIKEWWDEEPEANIGIVTGIESGLVVLDVDPRNGGTSSLEKIKEAYGEIPQTLCVKTGGGGWHYYFKHPGNGHVKCGACLGGYEGIDRKADGGYAVAPPSKHISGGKYEFSS